MIKEYALDPSLLNSWERVRYYCEQFGLEKGRMVSRFPKSWKKMVWDNSVSARPRERERIGEFLARMDARLVARSRTYDGAHAWHENAIRDHRREPFHAIVTDRQLAGAEAFCIRNDEFHEAHPLMAVPRHPRIPRTPKSVADFLTPMLSVAEWVLLIDAHFQPHPTESLAPPKWRPTRWTLPLAAILLRVPATCRVEFHTLRGTSRGTRIPEAVEDAKDNASWSGSCQALAHVLPVGRGLTVFRWQEKPRGVEFHERYVVSERCALAVDPGLDADHGTCDGRTGFSYLGEEDRQELMQRFGASSTDYTLLTRDKVVGLGDCLGEAHLRGLR